MSLADQEEGGQAGGSLHVPPGPRGHGPHLSSAAECPQQEVAPRLQPQGHLAGRDPGPGPAQGRAPQARQVLRSQEVRLQLLRRRARAGAEGAGGFWS